jgi:hypothetical protein
LADGGSDSSSTAAVFVLRMLFRGFCDSFLLVGFSVTSGGVASDSTLSQSISSSSSSDSGAESRGGPRPLCAWVGIGLLTCLFCRFFSTRSALRLSLRLSGALREPNFCLLFAGSAGISTAKASRLSETHLRTDFAALRAVWALRTFGACCMMEALGLSPKKLRGSEFRSLFPASPPLPHWTRRGHPTTNSRHSMAR